MITQIKLNKPQPKQVLFMKARKKHIGYGGARGGGKSDAIRTKAVLLALRYPEIRICIVRRTYAELNKNHIKELIKITANIANYNTTDKELKFMNGSTVYFQYCNHDNDLRNFQGIEYDVIFIDEATQLSEYQLKAIAASCRGVNKFPKRIYYTCNPGGQGHAYIKRIFIDKVYVEGEHPEDYEFIQAKVYDNLALMKSNPDYVRHLEQLPEKLRKAWLDGSWDIFEGQFFEDFVAAQGTEDPFKNTHVIEPFEIPSGWKIYRSYDFGYAKPFSCAWWAMDYDGTLYRILELYGCIKGEPNMGVKWTPDRQFEEIAKIEKSHRWLKGKDISGVADPSIWDKSRGESVAEVAMKHGIYFMPGDNSRIAGWMQCHYRLSFDANGYPGMYVFNTCKAFIRTIPLMQYSETIPEDLNTTLEDHVADEWRYMCMMRPIAPVKKMDERPIEDDPLNQRDRYGRPRKYGYERR